MTDTRAMTCTLELHAHLTELAQLTRALRDQLTEKERTNQLLQDRIVELQRELAKARGEAHGQE